MSLPPFLNHTSLAKPSPARLKALYASTSAQKESNPTGYEANLTWWSNALEECLASGFLGDDRLVFRVDEGLLERFENNAGGRPKGLGGVVSWMISTGKIHALPQFLNSVTPINDPGSLSYRLLAKPLLWTVGRLNPFGGGGESVEREEALWKRVSGKEYVHLGLLEKYAGKVMKQLESASINYSDSLYSTSSFREAFTSTPDFELSERDVEVLVKWLSRDQGVVVTNGEVIKIAAEGGEEISEVDIGTLTILTTIRNIEKQVESLSTQIKQHTLTAKEQLKTSRSLAMSSLKSKKNLEEILDKRLSTKHQLQTVLISIDTAQNDVEVMKAYETGTKTLKGVLKNPLLDLQKVERTAEEMAEVLASQEEIDQAIRVGAGVAVGAAGGGVDDDELEKELAELVLDEKERERERAEKAKEDAKKEQAERERAKEQAEKEQKEKEAKEAVKKVEQEGGKPNAANETTDSSWQKTYDEAQQRKADEAKRAELERMKRDEKRIAAE